MHMPSPILTAIVALAASCSGSPRPSRSPATSLSRQDRDDLVAFVEACSGSLPAVEKGRLPR